MLFLGTGSLYNHSTDPNMDAVQDASQRIGFIAKRDIEDGEELVFDYGYVPHFQPKGNYRIANRPKK